MSPAPLLPGSPWPRRIRNAAIALVVALAAIALVGFFAVPPLAKSKLESYLTESLGRKATLRDIAFNPFTLRASITDFALADRSPERTLLRFDTLDVALSLASVWKRAPVLDAVRLVRPQLDLVRNADGTYSVQDLIDRALAPSDAPTPRFSLNNIEIADGAVTLDDRGRRRKVALTSLGIGIPFLSSLPHDAEIRVTPHLEGAFDGARFKLAGTTSTPFADRREATLDLDLDALSLSAYAAYVPLPGGLKIRDGALTTRLKLAFVTEKDEPRTITLAGTARLDRLAVARADASPLARARTIDATLANLDLVGRTIALERVSIDAPDLELRRDAAGTLELARLLGTDANPTGGAGATSSPPSAATSPPAPAKAWAYSVADLRVANGAIRIADEAVSPAFRVPLSNVKLEARKIASRGGAGTVEIAFDSEKGAHFGATGDVDIGQGTARGRFALTKFGLAELYPYYAEAINLDVQRGTLDFAGNFEAAWSGASPQLVLTQGAATLADLDLAVRGEREPLWRLPHAEIAGVAFDRAKRAITFDRVEARPVSFRVVRQADGVVNFERLLPAKKATAVTPGATAQADAEWSVVTRKSLFERITVDIEDRVPQPRVRLRLADARFATENFGNVQGAKSTVDFSARVGSVGHARVAGSMVAKPFAIDWRVDLKGIDLVPLRPYYDARTNVVVTGGRVGAKGRVVFAGAGSGAANTSFTGDVTVDDFGSLDRPTSQELVRWKTLALTGVDVGTAPRKVALGAIALDGFYARLIVNADATLNLQQLLAKGPEAAPEPVAPSGAMPAPAPASTSASASGSASAPALTPAANDADAPRELPVSIGRIQVSNGEVQFSDFYVQPNYSAHLTDVSGSVSALSGTQAGDVEVNARVESTAPVEIRGTVNPFARELALDLGAKASDIDLPPLTPYSAKYAGYGITKGKLSFEVHYRIEQRKLAATNKLVLDQLTFGERVESPTATKLPILFAVSLLKDRNGVIRLDLPIQGTLDDPKFSVWGIVWQIIGNLITKAVTAPFALLGALAGSHGEELAFVEFAPGHGELSAAAEEKLRSLAKALADRPALKIDAAGRAVPDIDRDGLKHAALDRALRTQKQKALAADGASAPPVDTLTIDATERTRYLTAVYRDTDLPDKPRNLIGMAKDVPPAEMEARLLASYPVDDVALRTLANRRAQTVKEWFVGEGGIAPERVFIVAAKLSAEGSTDKGAPTRVDFAIR